ncbi:MAG: MFS transporter [Candidatus Velthaea sp.]
MNLRYLGVAACGGSAFIDMYATQPLLPELRAEFHTTEAAVSATISVLTFACAFAAPFVGPIADRVGRKRIIVSSIALLALVTLLSATATTLSSLLVWRFIQGLFMPGIFAVTLAYIAEEFPAEIGGRVIGAYIAGNVFGGFLGRYVSALVASRSNWQTAFVVLAGLNVAGALIVFVALPRAKQFRRNTTANFRTIGTFVRNPVLLATYGIGGSILFTLVAAFTYATFYLAEPPFSLGLAALGNVFFVYLCGVIATPLSGRSIDRFGHRFTLLASIATSVLGIALTLIASLPAIIAGLAVMATGVFCAQAASQGYIGVVVSRDRATAASLYITAYYLCGGLGAIVPAGAWSRGGWPATVAVIFAVQIVAAVLALTLWPARRTEALSGGR